MRLAIVVSRFNRAITDALLDGAREAAERVGAEVEDGDVYAVPGAFELPVVAARVAASARYDAVVCLGAVVRGETPHFDYVCDQAAAGIREVAVATGKPVGFGVLTTDDMAQAMAWAGGAVGNKGYDTVVAVVETLATLGSVRED